MILSEKANALSNFGFVGFGFIILACAIADTRNKIRAEDGTDSNSLGTRRNHLTEAPVISFSFAISMVYLGVASFIFHAHPSSQNYRHDQASIFVQFILLTGYTVLLYVPLNWRYAKFTRNVTLVATAIGLVVAVEKNLSYKISAREGWNLFFPAIGILVFGIYLNLALKCIQHKRTRPLKEMSKATVVFSILIPIVFIAALVAQEQIIDVPCRPGGVFQFHALWHVLISVGLFLLYLFYRSDHTDKVNILLELKDPESADSKKASDEAVKEPELAEPTGIATS